MPSLHKLHLNAKLTITLVVVLIAAIASMVLAVSTTAESRITQTRTRDLHGRGLSLLAGIDAMHQAIDADVIAQLAAFRTDLGALRVGPSGGLLTPDGTPLAGRFDEVDRVAVNPGSNATMFEKRGSDFVRVTTSVLKADGSRAVGTRLDPASPAYAAVSAGKRYVGRADLFGKTFDSVYEPLVIDGQTVGMYYIGRDIGPTVSMLSERSAKLPVGEAGFFVVLDHRGMAQVHPDAAARGKKLTDTGAPAMRAAFQDIARRGSGELRFTGEDGRDWIAVFDTFGAWKWTAVALVPAADLLSVARTVRTGLVAGGAALVVVLVLVLRALIGRLATRPLARLAAEVARAEQGELALRLAEHDGTNDEVMRLETTLARTFRRLHGLVGQVRSASSQVESASADIRSGTLGLSAQSGQQAASLQETASSMAQITDSVRSATGRAAGANRIAQSADKAAVEGGKVIGDAVASMTQIASCSRQIQQITGVIDSIAFQTNILALNAAVEAARAGETGRGFAVVASEVRSLAKRSADAANEIRQLIDQSAAQVDAGTRLVGTAGQAIEALVGSVREVAVAVDDISTASARQLDGIERVNETIGQLDAVTRQSVALVGQASSSTRSLAEQARELAEAVSVFRL